jgi:menaquinone-dependent protoporphyrinogen oxidase
MKLLIAYGTKDGMTARIAEHMAQTLRRHGHRVELGNTRVLIAGVDLSDYDAILVGASLHAGGYQRSTRRFVRKNVATLNRLPTAFFSVCLAIASKNATEREAAWSIARAFPPKLGWFPDEIEVIAGALMFSRYGFLRRSAMIRIARQELGDIDPTRDHIYTDWPAVERFALAFVERAARREQLGTAVAG